jgi:GT2 family glycosyltransferase
MEYLDYSKIQKINACVGAFIMLRRQVGESVGWWNEKYFFYGEDLDLCYKLHQKNYQLYYYPYCQITHYQGISSGIINQSQNLSPASRQTRIRSALASTQAMRIFYQENLFQKYPLILRYLVLFGINILELFRVTKAKYF